MSSLCESSAPFFLPHLHTLDCVHITCKSFEFSNSSEQRQHWQRPHFMHKMQTQNSILCAVIRAVSLATLLVYIHAPSTNVPILIWLSFYEMRYSGACSRSAVGILHIFALRVVVNTVPYKCAPCLSRHLAINKTAIKNMCNNRLADAFCIFYSIVRHSLLSRTLEDGLDFF